MIAPLTSLAETIFQSNPVVSKADDNGESFNERFIGEQNCNYNCSSNVKRPETFTKTFLQTTCHAKQSINRSM